MLTEEERRSRVWKKVCDYIEATTEENRRRNDAHLENIETTKLRARNEALTWLKEHFAPDPLEINEPESDFPFDRPEENEQ